MLASAQGNSLINLLDFSIPAFLIILAFITGRYIERRHFRNLAQREQQLSDMIISDVKTFPNGAQPHKKAELVMGQVVIATDYLKTFLAGLKKIFGGELKSYETLMERARREALLRMQEDARSRGYNAVCNVRLSFADIGGMSGTKGSVMVEIFAFGTAYCRLDA